MNQVKGKIQTENGRKSYTENSEPEPTGCTGRAGVKAVVLCKGEEMLLKINPYEIIHQIFVSNFGLEKYAYIIKHINQVNVAENREFQKMFNGFYRVRRDKA